MSISMLFCMSSSFYATELLPKVTAEEVPFLNEEVPAGVEVDVLDELTPKVREVPPLHEEVPAGEEVDVLTNKSSRSTSIPTEFYNLSYNRNYYGTIEELVAGSSSLYTNYYFNCSPAGEIAVSYDVTTNGIPGTLFIGLYDVDEREIVASWETDEFGYTPDDTLSSAVRFSNVARGHHYAIVFAANRIGMGTRPTITGDIIVYW